MKLTTLFARAPKPKATHAEAFEARLKGMAQTKSPAPRPADAPRLFRNQLARQAG